MKHSFIFSALLILVLISCNEANKPADTSTVKKDSSTAVENKIMIPASTCYFSTNGKDSFRLKVEVFPNVATGRFSNKFYEKDSNEGELDGHLLGDTLLADYKFMSEGKLSVRQVIFLIKDSTATEGYGDMEEKDGKMIFKNIKDVTFGKGLILKKADCGEY